MPYLCRKISRPKWESKPELAQDEIGADAVSGGCLRTKDNELSVWICKDDRSDVDEAILAIASSADHLETLNIVLIPDGDLDGERFPLRDSSGEETPIKDLAGRHRDIAKLDMLRLAEIAQLIASRARSNESPECVRRTKPQLKALLLQAISDRRVRREDFNDKLRSKLEP